MTGSRNLGDVVAGAPEPGRTALIDLADPAAPREWSFDDLDRAASAVARGLLARGGKRGDRVAVLSANRAEYLTVFLGAMRPGLVAVPVNLKLPAAAVAHILRDAGVSLVFVDRERRPLLPAGTAAVEFGAKPVAFVVRAGSDGPSAEAVKQWALANGPAYQHPRHVEFVAELPLAGTGKVDRKILMERAQALAGAARS